ncbi:MAG: hypothetical protein JST22_20415 [Bacteroidetes bacterium]|nr:hypothetical protein [Bacteroidota bacterium]
MLEYDLRKREWEGGVEEQAFFDEDGIDCDDNIYHAAFLLYHIHDLEDVELMWRAKCLNMDVGTMLDIENLLGAGVAATLEHMDRNNLCDAAARIRKEFAAESSLRFARWERQMREYFYGG